MPTQNYEHVRMIMKSPSGYNENNFCTVVAIATAFNWSAGKAHRLLAKHGRNHRKGPKCSGFTPALIEAAGKAGRSIEFTKEFDGVTINRFTKQNTKGTWVLLVRGHTLTVIDGVIQDWTADTAQRRKIATSTWFTQDGKNIGGAARIGD